MKTPLAITLLLLAALALAAGCARSEAEQAAPAAAEALSFEEVDAPAAVGSGEPNLHAADDGPVLLSWVEPGAEKQHALRFARMDDGAWSAPQTIAEGDDWFVNWADVPALVALDDPGSSPGQALAAHFLVKSGAAPYAYDVFITRSNDGGATWRPAARPHHDGTPTEHGFVSMLPGGAGRLLAVWLDGRNTGGGEGHDSHDGHGGGAMTLRTATLDADGALHDEAVLDERVCDCCPTAAARTAGGVVVAYRDRSDDEIRDIAIVRYDAGRWSAPRPVHADGWHIAGCPVNGPAVAAEDARVAVAWFTAAEDTARLRVSFSDDEGATFGPPLAVDDGNPVGRAAVALLPGGAALVSWIERTDDGAEIRVRRLHPDGTRAPSMTVAPTSPTRASGFPRLVRQGRRLYLAWTDARQDPPTVRTAVAAF